MSHAVFKQYWRYLLFPGFVDDIPESSEVPEAPEPHQFGESLYYVAMSLIRSFNE